MGDRAEQVAEADVAAAVPCRDGILLIATTNVFNPLNVTTRQPAGSWEY